MYNIFVADDEIWEIKGLKKLIEMTKLPVTVVGEASNGIAALEGLRSTNADILMTDIRMPGLDGLKLTEQIFDEGIAAKIVFISGYAEFQYAQKAIQLGVSDYLLKPVELESLKVALEKLIEELRCERNPVFQENEDKETDNTVSTIQKIIDEIQKSYMENLTLQSLSEKYCISPGHLSRLLKEEIGDSFTKYLTSLRIQKARELLADEKLSVEQVADMVGYHDYFYFTKVFRKTVGVTPSKFRKAR